jgi:ribosomal protein L32
MKRHGERQLHDARRRIAYAENSNCGKTKLVGLKKTVDRHCCG